MKHSYFRQLGVNVHTLPEGESAQDLSSVFFSAWCRLLTGAPAFQVFRYSRYRKCSCRKTWATGTRRSQTQVRGRHAYLHREGEGNNQVS